MKIYTENRRPGNHFGWSGGERVFKTDERVEAYGSVDD